jgi:hypothetical protein
MCLGAWSILGYVQDMDLKAVVSSPEIPEGEEEEDLPQDWDVINELEN